MISNKKLIKANNITWIYTSVTSRYESDIGSVGILGIQSINDAGGRECWVREDMKRKAGLCALLQFKKTTWWKFILQFIYLLSGNIIRLTRSRIEIGDRNVVNIIYDICLIHSVNLQASRSQFLWDCKIWKGQI